MSATSRYLLDNGRQEAADRFAALAALFDPTSTRHLERCGVGPGWRCLEVGAGGGSIATWLADRVGASGSVLATDIEPRFLTALAAPSLQVRRHDIGVDALPQGAFDLVHARLVPNARARAKPSLGTHDWSTQARRMDRRGRIRFRLDAPYAPTYVLQKRASRHRSRCCGFWKIMGSIASTDDSCTERFAPMVWWMWTRKVVCSCFGTAHRVSPCCALTTCSCAARCSRRVTLPGSKLNPT